MDKRKTIIIAAVILITLAVVLSGFFITLSAGIEASYRSKQAFQTPVIRFYWVFNLFLVAVEFGCLVYASVCWTSQKSLVPFSALFGAAILTLPAIIFGSAYKVDIPFSFSLGDEEYEIPWEFGPDAHTSARGSYLRIRTTYPDFFSSEGKREVSGNAGLKLMAARITSPDILCVGGVGCTSVIGEIRSKLPISQQLKDTVTKHLKIDQSIDDFQIVRIQKAEVNMAYFYKNESGLNQDIYGVCSVERDYRICDYLFSDGEFYYNINVDFSDELLENSFQPERDIPLINLEIVELFNSLKKSQ